MKIFLKDLWNFSWPWLVSLPVVPLVILSAGIFVYGVAILINWFTTAAGTISTVCGWALLLIVAMIVVRISGFPEWLIDLFKRK